MLRYLFDRLPSALPVAQAKCDPKRQMELSVLCSTSKFDLYICVFKYKKLSQSLTDPY